MKKILITGGAGFVGSNIAIAIKEHFVKCEVVALDNLHRKGAELNIPRLEEHGVEFLRGDVRNSQDLERAGEIDFLIECSAEPSVLAGSDGDTEYLIQTNLNGAINCADVCRKYNAPMLFLSTSRVYPIEPLLNCEIRETPTRFEWTDNQKVSGLSSKGLSEAFPMEGARSLYGGTKYAAEVMLREYSDAFDLPIIINRCGVLAGPWQFGKADQGIAAFWTAAHMFKRNLKYIGFEGSGKQVRDMLHIDDLIRLVMMQIEKPELFGISEGQTTAMNIQYPIGTEGDFEYPISNGKGEMMEEDENQISNGFKSPNPQITKSPNPPTRGGVWNVGGGVTSSASLLELTEICQEITGNTVDISPEPKMRYADIPIYITDTGRIERFCGWKPEKGISDIVIDIHLWIKDTPGAKELFL